jgi:hypothetical protein
MVSGEFITLLNQEAEELEEGYWSEPLSVWKAVVVWCEDGYPYSYDDYLYEARSRSALEQLLQSDTLSRHQDFEEFKKCVYKLDERFKACQVESPRLTDRDWWEASVPKRARYAFVFSMPDMFRGVVEEIK